MKFRALMLADFASVRDGLLFVVGGGVKVVYLPALPAPLPLTLAGLVEIGQAEYGADGTALLDVKILVSRKGKKPLLAARGLTAVQPKPGMSSKEVVIPFAIDMRRISVSTETEHFIHVQAGALRAKVPFEVVVQIPEIPADWAAEFATMNTDPSA